MTRNAADIQAEIDRLIEKQDKTWEKTWQLKQELAEVYERENVTKYVKVGEWKWGDPPYNLIGKYVRSMGSDPSRPFAKIERFELSSERHYNFSDNFGRHIYWSMNDQPPVDLYEEVPKAL